MNADLMVGTITITYKKDELDSVFLSVTSQSIAAGEVVKLQTKIDYEICKNYFELLDIDDMDLDTLTTYLDTTPLEYDISYTESSEVTEPYFFILDANGGNIHSGSVVLLTETVYICGITPNNADAFSKKVYTIIV